MEIHNGGGKDTETNSRYCRNGLVGTGGAGSTLEDPYATGEELCRDCRCSRKCSQSIESRDMSPNDLYRQEVSIHQHLRHITLTENPWGPRPPLPATSPVLTPRYLTNANPTPTSRKGKENLKRLALADSTNRSSYVHVPRAKGDRFIPEILLKFDVCVFNEDMDDKVPFTRVYIDTAWGWHGVAGSW